MAKNPISTYDELEQKIKELKPGDHLCCMYETEEEHRAILTPFLREGLRAGQKIIYIVDARTAEEIFSYMHEDGVDVDDYVKTGQLHVLSVDESYMRGGVFDPDGMISLLASETTRALAEGYTALRVTGEMSWTLRGLPGSDRLIEYEIKLNEFFPDHQCLAICQYDRRRFEPGILLDVLTTHPIAIIGTEVFDNFYYMTPEDMLGPSPEGARLNNWLDHLAIQKRTRVTLQESEETVKAIVNASTASVLMIDAAGTILSLNEASARSLGKRADELVGHCMYDQFPPSVSARRRGYVEEVIRKGKPLCFEDELKGRGFEHWVYPVLDADGTVKKLAIYVQDITQRKQTEEALRRNTYELGERIKELNCLYAYTNLIERPGISLSEIFQGLVGIIPPGWQYPEITCARLVFEDQIFKTANFNETVWKLSSPVLVYGGRVGTLEVYYREEKPEGDEGPFLKEERDLLNALAWRLGKAIERKQAEEDLLFVDARQKALLELYQMLDVPLDEIVKYVLKECIRLSRSTLGFIGFTNEDETIMSAYIWSEKVLKECLVADKPTQFFIAQGGLWAESIRQHRPIIVNDYLSPNPYKRGLPEGHVSLSRFMCVPIFSEGCVVAMAGVANKEKEYSETDLLQITLLLEGMWSFMQRRKADEAILRSRDELEIRVEERTTELMKSIESLRMEMVQREQAEETAKTEHALREAIEDSILTGIVVFDLSGRIMHVNPAFCRIVGWSEEELVGMKPPFAYWPPEEIETIQDAFQHTINGTKPLSGSDEFRFQRKNGELFDVLLLYAPLKDASGRVIGNVASVGDITERKQAEEALKESGKQLKHLSSELLNAHEKERKRVAGEIHDSIGQSLSAIKFRVENVLQQLGKSIDKKMTKPLEDIIPLVRASIEEVRRIQTDLRPSLLDDLGILATIDWFCREFQITYSHLRIEKLIDIQESEIPESLKIVIYRILGEALHNVAKHSKADLIRLSLQKTDSTIALTIQDNGKGFDLEKIRSKERSRKGLGLISMQERTELSGGSFAFESGRRGGTVVRAVWPL